MKGQICNYIITLAEVYINQQLYYKKKYNGTPLSNHSAKYRTLTGWFSFTFFFIAWWYALFVGTNKLLLFKNRLLNEVLDLPFAGWHRGVKVFRVCDDTKRNFHIITSVVWNYTRRREIRIRSNFEFQLFNAEISGWLQFKSIMN